VAINLVDPAKSKTDRMNRMDMIKSRKIELKEKDLIPLILLIQSKE